MAQNQINVSFGVDTAELLAGVKKCQTGISNFCTKSVSGLQNVTSQFTNLAATTVKVAAGFATLGGALSVAGIVAYGSSIFDLTLKQERLAARLQITGDQLRITSYAFKSTGADVDRVADALSTMSELISDAAIAGSGSLAPMFKQLGVEASTFNNLDLNGKMLKLADTFSKMKNSDAIYWAKEMGDDVYELLPVLQKGSAHIKAMQDEAIRLGQKFGATVSQIAEAQANIDKVKTIGLSLSQRIMVELSKPLSDFAEVMATKFLEWVESKGGFSAVIVLAKDALIDIAINMSQSLETIVNGFIDVINGIMPFIKSLSAPDRTVSGFAPNGTSLNDDGEVRSGFMGMFKASDEDAAAYWEWKKKSDEDQIAYQNSKKWDNITPVDFDLESVLTKYRSTFNEELEAVWKTLGGKKSEATGGGGSTTPPEPAKAYKFSNEVKELDVYTDFMKQFGELKVAGKDSAESIALAFKKQREAADIGFSATLWNMDVANVSIEKQDEAILAFQKSVSESHKAEQAAVDAFLKGEAMKAKAIENTRLQIKLARTVNTVDKDSTEGKEAIAAAQRAIAQEAERTSLDNHYTLLAEQAALNGENTALIEEERLIALNELREKYRLEDIEREKKANEQKYLITERSSSEIMGDLQANGQGKLNFNKMIKDKEVSQTVQMGQELLGEAAKHNRKAFEMQKAMSYANIIMNTYEMAVKAYNSLASIPYVGPALGVAAAGAAIMFGTMQAAQVKNSQFQGQAHDGLPRVPKANEGTFMLRQDEMVLNPKQADNFDKVVEATENGGIGGGVNVHVNYTIQGSIISENEFDTLIRRSSPAVVDAVESQLQMNGRQYARG